MAEDLRVPYSVKISVLTQSLKKMQAIFYNELGEELMKTLFGATGYSDYTIHQNDERKERYIKRHQVNEDWSNPMKAGTLSRYILWNKKTVQESIKDFKKRFHLQ